MSFDPSIPTIQSLRKRGYKLRVTHKRIIDFKPFQSLISKQRNPLDLLQPPIPVVARVTKADKKAKLYPFIYEKGGETTIEVTGLDGITRQATASCSIKDAFNRKLGNHICLARLFKKGAI